MHFRYAIHSRCPRTVEIFIYYPFVIGFYRIVFYFPQHFPHIWNSLFICVFIWQPSDDPHETLNSERSGIGRVFGHPCPWRQQRPWHIDVQQMFVEGLLTEILRKQLKWQRSARENVWFSLFFKMSNKIFSLWFYLLFDQIFPFRSQISLQHCMWALALCNKFQIWNSLAMRSKFHQVIWFSGLKISK